MCQSLNMQDSFLFNGGNIRKKRQSNTTFDVTMGSYDGTEVCELVGLFILNSLAEKYGKDYVGLYHDGLILLKGISKRLADKARNYLYKLFAENFQLTITAEKCHQTVNFRDLTFNLQALLET